MKRTTGTLFSFFHKQEICQPMQNNTFKKNRRNARDEKDLVLRTISLCFCERYLKDTEVLARSNGVLSFAVQPSHCLARRNTICLDDPVALACKMIEDLTKELGTVYLEVEYFLL
jgi:hypothetical protein